jgi:hypothetical protein
MCVYVCTLGGEEGRKGEREKNGEQIRMERRGQNEWSSIEWRAAEQSSLEWAESSKKQ